MSARLVCAAAAALVACTGAAAAQPAAAAKDGRVVLTGAVRWSPSSDVGQATAGLTPGTGQGSYPLFSASGAMGAHAAVEAGAGVRLSPAVRVLFVGTVAWPELTVRLSGDAEGAPPVEFAGESLVQWTAGGRVEYDVNALRFASGRAVPFLAAGVAFLWQSHEAGAGLETGGVFEIGGGVRYRVRSRPASRMSSLSLVADVRVTRTTGGVTWNDQPRTAPAFGLGVAAAWGRVRKAA